MRKRWLLAAALPVVAVAVFLSVSDTARRFTFHGTTMLTAVAAKLACSGAYLMGRAPDEVVARDLQRFYGPWLNYTGFDFEEETRTVNASFFGLAKRTAVYRDGLGCTLMIDTEIDQLLEQARGIEEVSRSHRPQEWPEGDLINLTRNAAGVEWQVLDEAVDGAFEDNTEFKIIDTRAVIVVYGGKIVAARYADGFNHDSRFLSWSASKSVTGALIGTLVTDGKLDLYAPAPVKEWASADDPRHVITLHQLMTMSSGLEFSEPYLPGNDSTDMLFKTRAMGDFAAGKPLFREPGTLWDYSSGTTNLLSRILQEQAGGSLKAVHDYSWSRFFEPVGMRSAVFEPDASGSHVGSSYFYASAPDWARFGLLFLNRGRVGGRQILSEQWVDYSRTPTPLAPKGMYGAQFWLNAGHPERDDGLMMPDCPKDMFTASGYNGQHIAIVPSKQAVVLRFGWTTVGASFDTNKHFGRILATLPDTSVQSASIAP